VRLGGQSNAVWGSSANEREKIKRQGDQRIISQRPNNKKKERKKLKKKSHWNGIARNCPPSHPSNQQNVRPPRSLGLEQADGGSESRC